MGVIRVTTDPGIEDIAADELRTLLDDKRVAIVRVGTDVFSLPGVVAAELSPEPPIDLVQETLFHCKSIYHVVVHVGEVSWGGRPLDELARDIARLPFERLNSDTTFRVSCSRAGEHPFHSPDVEREVGTAIQARFSCPVKLTRPDLNLRVDIVGDRCLCGYQLTGKKGLDRRYPWRYHPRVTLRTTIAYSMLRIAGFVDRPGALLDPFCGSGTILLEAASVVHARLAPGIPLVGSEIRKTAVDGCRLNIEAAGFSDLVSVRRSDALELAAWAKPSSLDYIVTNPPFGIRLGANRNLAALYAGFLKQASIVLRPGGVLAMLVAKRGAFNRVLGGFDSFHLLHVRIIEIGGVFPGLFVLRRV